jgi:hypothetical protein
MNRTCLGLATCLAALSVGFVPPVLAQAPAAPAAAAPALSSETLDRLVGRIALYPDDLIAIILPAATNPLQVVQADRFLDKRKADPKAKIDDKWDDAIKSLVNYPEVIKQMSGDLDWTAALGEAVVADQGDVLDAIQAFRRKTQSAGNLKTDAKQVIVVEKEVIKIVPADPQVIYVPQYNPTTVVVYSSAPVWGYYPTPYPVYYYPYPPGAALATGLIWGAAIGAAWNGNHYAAHYGGSANININNSTTINSINTGNAAGAPRQQTGATSSQWQSNKQPGQVGSSIGVTSTASAVRVGESRSATSAQPAAKGTAAASTQRTGGGAVGGATDGATAAGSAFDGYGSGRQTQMDSSRGAASRQSAQQAPANRSRGGRR